MKVAYWLLGLVLALSPLLALEDCTTHILADADETKLRSSLALEGQMYKDLAPDAGVPYRVLRAEAAGLYCSDHSVLAGSNALPTGPDGGVAPALLACPK